jgi:small subunit ribosomal protein S8
LFVDALSAVVLVASFVISIFAASASARKLLRVIYRVLRSLLGNFMVTDPVADLITRLKNAGAVKHASVSVPFSNFKMAIAEKLKDAGYVSGVDKKGKKVKKTLEVVLKYGEDGKAFIKGVKRVSKPGRRLYRSADQITRVRYGYGALILSTPKGIKTDKEARKEKVGGEALFEIW